MPFLALLFLGESLLFAPISHSAFKVLPGKQFSGQKPDALNSNEARGETGKPACGQKGEAGQKNPMI